MKALSIQQPWAWAILHGKDCENRTWPTAFRGFFLIHAGMKPDPPAWRILAERYGLHPPPRDRIPLGGIVGKAKLYACVTDSPSRWFCGPFGFMLADAEATPFVRCPGQLNFFDVPAEVLSQLHNNDPGPLFRPPPTRRKRENRSEHPQTTPPGACPVCLDHYWVTNADAHRVPCPACGVEP